MVDEGYSLDFSTAVTAASATIGPIIPPSIPMVIYGAMAGESVAKLLIAGFFPGVLMGLMMMALLVAMAPWYGWQAKPRATVARDGRRRQAGLLAAPGSRDPHRRDRHRGLHPHRGRGRRRLLRPLHGDGLPDAHLAEPCSAC